MASSTPRSVKYMACVAFPLSYSISDSSVVISGARSLEPLESCLALRSLCFVGWSRLERELGATRPVSFDGGSVTSTADRENQAGYIVLLR
jgi:hypothetical protein